MQSSLKELVVPLEILEDKNVDDGEASDGDVSEVSSRVHDGVNSECVGCVE